jgi:hypothetical protein
MLNAESIAARELPRILATLLDEPLELARATHRDGYDFVGRTADRAFVFEVKSRDDVASLERASQQLQGYARFDPQAVPVLVVPFMGPKAREWARERGLSWLDLSGNGDIRGPRLRLHVEGQPNRFASPGRPSTAFSDKAARLTRAMLVEPQRWWRQHDLVEATRLSAGYVSKVTSRLRSDGLLDESTESGGIRPRAPSVLLDAWAQVYDFRRHDIARYHAVGRTGPAVAEALAEGLTRQTDLRWAATGLTAAWRMRRFADHRLVTFFVSEPPADLERLGLRPVDRGENVWLVVPRDDGVFYAAQEVSGLPCVHPVQTWIDLLGHPERATESARDLRELGLRWSDI